MHTRSSGLLAPGYDLGAGLADYATLFESSRFVAVATADIILMSILASVLVAEDASRRGWEDKAPVVAGATLLLPVLGPAVYLAARPPLEE